MATVPAPQFIVNGQLDEGGYPQVGTFVRTFPSTTGPLLSRCSGTLIGRKVLLTAGHCVQRALDAGLQHGDYGVSFDAVYVPGVSRVFLGTGYAYPGFTETTFVNDVSVLVLDQPVVGVKPKKLARPGLLEKVPSDELAGKEFITVGYGVAIPPASGRGTRRVAVQHFLSLCTFDLSTGVCAQDGGHPEYNWVALGGPFESGNGTICSGDSGGPHFLDDRIVAVTSLGTCGSTGAALEWAQRVDIKPVRQFIMSFLEDDEGDH